MFHAHCPDGGGNHKDPSNCVRRNLWYFCKPLSGETASRL